MFSLSCDINPCHSLFFDRDHLRFNMAIISGSGSFAVQFGDHLRSGIICGPGILCGPVQYLVLFVHTFHGNNW